jgi:hypothetical protein
VSDNATRLAESREGGHRCVPQLQVHERVGAPLDGLQSEICRGSPDPGLREMARRVKRRGKRVPTPMVVL